jgi:hypothetical protein
MIMKLMLMWIFSPWLQIQHPWQRWLSYLVMFLSTAVALLGGTPRAVKCLLLLHPCLGALRCPASSDLRSTRTTVMYIYMRYRSSREANHRTIENLQSNSHVILDNIKCPRVFKVGIRISFPDSSPKCIWAYCKRTNVERTPLQTSVNS